MGERGQAFFDLGQVVIKKKVAVGGNEPSNATKPGPSAPGKSQPAGRGSCTKQPLSAHISQPAFYLGGILVVEDEG